MSHPKVHLRALRGFHNGTQYVRRGGTCYRSRSVADDLIRAGYAEEIPSPVEALVKTAAQLGVGLVIADGTRHAAEIVKAAAKAKAGVADQRTPPPPPKAKKGAPKG